ncbi:MAG: tRNA preQ1(34) S-adenosylmethionine ribosyltransferase-isomerase QueA [Paracoccaceae bacterium]
MRTDDFDFDLPENLIALRPAYPRPASRLLVAGPERLVDSHVHALGDYLQKGDLLVFNDTKVLAAYLAGTRLRDTADGSGRAHVAFNLIARLGGDHWRALARPAKRLKLGDRVAFAHDLAAEVCARNQGEVELRFNLSGAALDAAIERAGDMPLPPYIASRRPADAADRADYQTVFATRPGAVAAPTASLHFDDALLAQLSAKGVESCRVTLHVGAGTFLPVKVDDIASHKMHAEWGEISAEAARAISRAHAEGRRVIPVGTTALRLIESAATARGVVEPWQGETDIFIHPGYAFKATSGLMTNFHLPRSTLLMLVSALMGLERMREVYAHAIAQNYRFFSYGDSSLLLPRLT